mmetsp:Transcript_18492/g.42659  ORF Transcript_18492/g.42659 Transcript_18492/m.42659 type:complete len:82 (+) Transcript_18492:93-338(+)
MRNPKSLTSDDGGYCCCMHMKAGIAASKAKHKLQMNKERAKHKSQRERTKRRRNKRTIANIANEQGEGETSETIVHRQNEK